MGINYSDLFSEQWGSYSKFLNKRQVDATGHKIKVYTLDKQQNFDDLYNESKNPVYLPYFTIRGLYVTNKWAQVLSFNGLTETEEPTTIVLNMDDMVNTMRNLRVSHLSDIYITYTGANKASVSSSNNILTIKENCNIIREIDLTQYNITDLTDEIHSIMNFDCSFTKDGKELASNLVSFLETPLPTGDILNVYSLDNKYQDLTDTIKIGDLVITHHNVLYEVMNASVYNLQFFQWPTYVLTLEKKFFSGNLTLPDNGNDIIYDNGYLLGNVKIK